MNLKNFKLCFGFTFFLLCSSLTPSPVWAKNNTAAGIVVVQTDFGLKDGAVSEVKGVMYSVNKSLLISDLTHEIPPFNIWEASYRLHQTAPYWPKGTVFVSVVDPGVGTKRKSVVAETKNGQYFVTPDNGTLTFIANTLGIKEVREIDETKNRLSGSSESYTFYGRDLYGYTAARLASGVISFEEVGPKLTTPIVMIPYQKASLQNQTLKGTIIILDPEYGNIWTNIPRKLMDEFGMKMGNDYNIRIYHGDQQVFDQRVPYRKTFGEVPQGTPLIYSNSLLNLALGINQGNFSERYRVKSGADWRIEIKK